MLRTRRGKDWEMSWQEELRKLDADLAAGKLTKAQYVSRREELLAEASSAPARPRQSTDAPTEKERITPGKPPVSAQDLLATDRPTTAPSPADEQPTDSIPYPAKPPAQETKPYERPAAPPVPPVPPQQTPPRAMPNRIGTQDQALPAAPEEASTGKGKVLVAVGIVVAVLIGGAVWWFSSTENTDTPPSAAPPQKTTTQASPAPRAGSSGPGSVSGLVDELPQLPGVLNRNSGTYTPAEAAQRKLFGVDEAALLDTTDVERVTWKGSSRRVGKAELAYVVLVAENSSRAKTEATAKAMRKLSASRVPKSDGLPGHAKLPTYRKLSDDVSVYRVIYTSGTKTIRLGIVATPGGDNQRLKKEMTVLLDDITRTLPPNER
jgi:hypothetical protein